MQQADILAVAKSFVPRSQTWLYDEVAHLRRHRVHVVTQRLLNREEYPHEPLTLLPSNRSLAAVAERLPYRLIGLQPPVFCRAARNHIRDMMNSGNFGLVQAHFGWVGRGVAADAADADLPLVVWLYGADVFHRAEARRLPSLFSREHSYCCTSHALRRRMEELGCPPERIHVFYPGVRVPEVMPGREPSDRVRILSVGRLVQFKDPIALVRVARALRDRGHAISWRHLGNGPLRKKVQRAVAKHRLEDCFELSGTVPHDSVLEAMARADLMIHAAVIQPDGRRESFGVVLAEAAASGLPIVTVGIGGIPEVVVGGSTGFLVRPGDYGEMTAKAEMLIAEPGLRLQFGEAAHRHALEKFELQAQVEELDQFYDGVLS